jgi:hypothetical protein
VQTRETRSGTVILITEINNSLLKAVFELKLQHPGLKTHNLRLRSRKVNNGLLFHPC